MTTRRTEHVYRLRWMRPKWSHPSVKLFTRRAAAIRYEEKIRAAWNHPGHAVLWTELDVAVARWEHDEITDTQAHGTPIDPELAARINRKLVELGEIEG